MREILFRGKCLLLGRWMYGSLVQKKTGKVYINSTEVNPSTIGQYTGLTDKNGTKIFEGDIVTATRFPGNTKIYEVAWNDGMLGWGAKQNDVSDKSFPEEIKKQGYCFSGGIGLYENQEVIGNIHEEVQE